MFNPMQILNMMSMKSNPQAFQNMMSQQLQSNPLFRRAQQMADGKSPEEIQQICKNLCQQRGIDLDQAIDQFKNQFGYK